jgi:tRNA nucleotidyltransferase (CCA-adding enzyme)
MMKLSGNKKLSHRVSVLVECHMRPFQLVSSKAKNGAWRRLHLRCDRRLDVLGLLCLADWSGRPNRDPIAFTDHGVVVTHASSAACNDFQAKFGVCKPKPMVTGKHLIAHGFSPSPKFSVALKDAFNHQINDDKMSFDQLLDVALSHF